MKAISLAEMAFFIPALIKQKRFLQTKTEQSASCT
jgi:hypothetical protein